MKVLRLLSIPLLAITVLFATYSSVHAATCTRLATDFTLFDWNDTSKWDCGFVPGPADIAVIPGQEDFFDPVANIALNEEITLRGLIMEGGRIEGNHRITVTEQMVWSGGDLHYTNTAPFVSPSVIVIAPAAELIVEVDASIMSSSGTFINEGETIWRTGAYTFSPPSLGGGDSRFINNGTFIASASRATWNVELTNNGTLKVTPDGTDAVTIGALENSGNVTIQSGTLNSSYRQITGTTTLDAGKLNDFTFTGISLEGGRFGGNGTVSGIFNHTGGTLAPTGIMRFADPGVPGILYSQGISATLEMSIDGVTRGTLYDSLTIEGRAEFLGTLDTLFQDGFVIGEEDGFIIAHCTTECTGEFVANTSPLTINYNTNLYTLGAEVELPAQAPLLLPFILGPQPQALR